MIGRSIAHYKVTGKLGTGGMGEVWRATDSKLSREVALKILPEVFSADSDRVARFHREAHLLASLSHPNIAAIHGAEEIDGRLALVLELVEGPDLRERLAAGPLPPDEALDGARQIAEALEAAHEKGIVHRDLKPANVKIAPDGQVKVLDFGLAKALEGESAAPAISGRAASLSPTLTAASTRAGVVLGTAAYMSPEQARGKRIDRRSDIFSFGSVLFEMLARRPCFAGETVSDTLASVIKDPPDWSRIPSGTPPGIVSLLRRCLEKDPRKRLQAIGEARIALEAVLKGGPDALDLASGSAAAPQGAGRALARTGLLALAGLAAIVAAGLAGWRAGSTGSVPPPVRFALEAQDLSTSYTTAPAISPDGERIAYVAGGSLWIRDLDSLQPRSVEGSEGARAPFWSPDGAWLGFTVGETVKRVAADGGRSDIVSHVPFPSVDGAAWAEGDTIYLAPGQGSLLRLPAQGGDAQPFIEPDIEEESDFHTPRAVPGGEGLIYSVHRRAGVDTIEVFSRRSRRVILRLEGERIQSAVYDSGGYILYERHGTNAGLWAMPFSLASLERTGEPFLLDADGANPTVSLDGTLLYTSGIFDEMTELVWIDRSGSLLGPAGPEMPRLSGPEISPDGGMVFASSRAGEESHLWMLDLGRGTWSQAGFGDRDEWHGQWSPRGDRIFVSHGAPGQFRTLTRSLDGSDEVEMFIDGGIFASFDDASRWLVYTSFEPETGIDVRYRPLDGEGDDRTFLSTPENEGAAAVSPDGRLVAYSSGYDLRYEVYVIEFPSGKGRQQVSAGGGIWPRWSRDGKEIYYISQGDTPSLMSVSVEAEPRLRLGVPRRLFGKAEHPDLDWKMQVPQRQYDVSADGERFLMVRSLPRKDAKPPRMIVTQRWVDLLGKDRS